MVGRMVPLISMHQMYLSFYVVRRRCIEITSLVHRLFPASAAASPPCSIGTDVHIPTPTAQSSVPPVNDNSPWTGSDMTHDEDNQRLGASPEEAEIGELSTSLVGRGNLCRCVSPSSPTFTATSLPS